MPKSLEPGPLSIATDFACFLSKVIVCPLWEYEISLPTMFEGVRCFRFRSQTPILPKNFKPLYFLLYIIKMDKKDCCKKEQLRRLHARKIIIAFVITVNSRSRLNMVIQDFLNKLGQSCFSWSSPHHLRPATSSSETLTWRALSVSPFQVQLAFNRSCIKYSRLWWEGTPLLYSNCNHLLNWAECWYTRIRWDICKFRNKRLKTAVTDQTCLVQQERPDQECKHRSWRGRKFFRSFCAFALATTAAAFKIVRVVIWVWSGRVHRRVPFIALFFFFRLIDRWNKLSSMIFLIRTFSSAHGGLYP